MKTLLMLGGGFLQTFVIKKAKAMGYCVHVLDADPKALGFAYSDEHAVINIIDEESCLKYAKKHKIDGVLTAATDFSVLTMSRISTELNLPGINYESAKIIKNKAMVRKILFEAKADDTSYAFQIRNENEIAEIATKLKFPVMVKPCDGSGSRGTSRVDNIDDFSKACRFAMSASITNCAVVEPFIIGKEYGVESFVDKGEVHVLAVMQKQMTEPPYYAELGHAIPCGLPLELELKIKDCVHHALVALNVNHGSVNMDLLVTETGNVHIVDVGARMGGNLIGSHIIPIGTGIDYMGNMIAAAVGDSTSYVQVSKPISVATKLLALTPGVVAELPNFETIAKTECVEILHHLHIGDRINEYHTNLDGCGYVVSKAENLEDAINKAKDVKEKIDNSILRK